MASGDSRENDGFRSSSTLINHPSSKKQKVIKTLDDRISYLPEPLLTKILSLLPTKLAFATSVLSKRWIYLWTFVDSFSFCCETVESVPFISYVLAHSVSTKIVKFELHLGLPVDDSVSLLHRCLSFAVSKKVENVVLSYSYKRMCLPLPHFFHTCSSLVTLHTSSVWIKYDAIEWKSLRSLKLESSIMFGIDAVNLFTGCPVLESIELDHSQNFERLEINSSILKRLKFNGFWSIVVGPECFEIIAPNLQHLEISGTLSDVKCRLVDVSSVVSAELTFDDVCIYGSEFYSDEECVYEEDRCAPNHLDFARIQEFLLKLNNATELIIGTWFVNALCMLQFHEVLIPELKCRYLTLQLQIKKFNLYGAAALLRASPHVETLHINVDTTPQEKSRCCFGLRFLAAGDQIDLLDWISSFVFPNLKNVKIVISFEVCLEDHCKRGFDKLCKLSEFLLKTAVVLEKFVIISKRMNCKRCSMNCIPLFLFGLAEKLHGYPRSSAKSKIIFEKCLARKLQEPVLQHC